MCKFLHGRAQTSWSTGKDQTWRRSFILHGTEDKDNKNKIAVGNKMVLNGELKVKIMSVNLFILVLIFLSNTTFGQRKEQKESYPANVEKIENIKAMYAGCTLGPCYFWWSIVLKGDDELLMQSGAHHPAGSRTRHFPIGTWRISGDTLKLDIILC